MSDTMERLNAALEGRYVIEGELGEGGMATVYLADDVKHERKVALKVLKPELAAVVGAERFLAEIKTTANLQHPHVLPLFDSGEADSFLFYVMPYVQGETLADRIDQEKQLPVDEAVRIAIAVAGALDHAHRAGVVHRDIKPANILLQDGQPVVADFGIALAVGAAGGSRLTETGLSIGTPFYMSPEQATGDQGVGAASDTYALACVLYELLVGEPPYLGNTAQAVLGKIISGRPVAPTEHRSSIPANVDAAIRKALEKLPADRFTSAQDFAKALEDPGYRHGELAGAGASVDGDRWKRIAMGFAAATVVFGGVSAYALLRPEAPAPVSRYSIALPESEALDRGFGSDIAISPDGSRFVYVGVDDDEGDRPQLWLRRRDQLGALALPGTSSAQQPTFSPDGESVAFFTFGPNSVKVASLGGGPPLTVADEVLQTAGLTWAPDGFLYLDMVEGLGRVPPTGGEITLVTTLGEAETSHSWPDALPNGRGVLFTIFREPVTDQSQYDIAVMDLDSGEHQVLVRGVYGRYAAPGHLVYVTADGTMMAAPFDADRLEVTGPAVSLTEGLGIGRLGGTNLALSKSGDAMYETGTVSEGLHEFTWVTRSGEAISVDSGWSFRRGDANRGWTLSPDGSRLALRALAEDNYDIWVKELPRGPLSRLTFHETQDKMPQWTPDGESVLFLSDRLESNDFDLWTKRADGTGEAELLYDSESSMAEGFVSEDGEWTVLRVAGVGGVAGGRDIVAVRSGGDGETLPLLVGEYDESSPQLSPDGRWMAYQSNETGRDEIFVRPFPDVQSGKWQVSTDGGRGPAWAHSGQEIFYTVPAGSQMVAAKVSAESAFRVESRETLFSTAGYTLGNVTRQWDVTGDDQRFLMVRPFGVDEETSNQLIVVENFTEELKRRVPN